MPKHVCYSSDKGSANRILLLGFIKMYVHTHNKEENNLLFSILGICFKSHGTLNFSAKKTSVRLLEFYLSKVNNFK